MTSNKEKIDNLKHDTPVTYPCQFSEIPDNNNHFAYGSFSYPCDMTFGKLQISITEENGLNKYLRTYNSGQKTAEWLFSSNKGNLLIHPVQPNHKPSPVTDFLEIKFKPIGVAPKSSCTVLLTFPIEIACVIESEPGIYEQVDHFTCEKPQFSLYGTPSRGILARYHESEVYRTIPPVKNHKYGILHLTINNVSDEWISIGHIILYMKGMVLRFNDRICSACAEMNLDSKNLAHTAFTVDIFGEGMQTALNLFEERKMDTFAKIPKTAIKDTIYMMDMGLI